MSRTVLEPGVVEAIPLLAALPADERSRLLGRARTVTFEPDEAVFERAQPARTMYIVTKGSARVDVGGRHHDLKRGDILGEMGVLSSKPRMRTVRALDPFEALEIDCGDIDRFLEENPRVAISVLKVIVERLREVEERLDAWMGIYVA